MNKMTKILNDGRITKSAILSHVGAWGKAKKKNTDLAFI